MPAKCVLKVFEAKFGLRFEVFDGKTLGKFGGRLLYLASKALDILGRISEKNNQELRFKIRVFCQKLHSREGSLRRDKHQNMSFMEMRSSRLL